MLLTPYINCTLRVAVNKFDKYLQLTNHTFMIEIRYAVMGFYGLIYSSLGLVVAVPRGVELLRRV